MIKNFKQFVPSQVCLKCDGCCRFKESDSRWRPQLTAGEITSAVKAGIPEKIFINHVVGADQRIKTTPCAEGFLCHFLNSKDNTCGIYHARPFECQLYPFLLGREGNESVLYVHLNCPHIQQNWGNDSYKEYVQYLQEFLQRPDVIDFLKANPALMTDYSAFRDELDYVCAIPLE